MSKPLNETFNICIRQWLEYGQQTFVPDKQLSERGHRGYYSQGGWAYETLKKLGEDLQQIQDENTRLRAALAMSPLACAYCQLPAEEWAKCQSGFPGCARADDMTGCPVLCCLLLHQTWEEENVQLRRRIKDLEQELRVVQER